MTRSARRSLLLTTALAGTLLHGAARAADLPVPTNAMEPGLTYDAANTRLDVDLANTSRIINWNSFDVAANKVVNFTTADTTSRYSVLNRVAPGDPSDIFGAIGSSGNIAVWLANPSGITFGATGSFSGGSLVLTTAAIRDTDWTTAIGSMNPAAALVPLTGAPVPVTDAMTGVTTGAIVLAEGSLITAAGGVAAAAQSVTAGGRISAGGEVALVAATDLALPFGVGSPLGVRIDKGTKVGRVAVGGTAQIDAAVVRLAGASTDGQAAYLLQVDDGATLTATTVNGKVVLAAGVAGDGVTLGAAAADVSGAASIRYDGKATATQTGGSATLGASGDIVTATAHGTIAASGAIGIVAGGNAAIGAALASTAGDVTVGSNGATLVQSAVGAGGAYRATGASVTLGTAGTAIAQTAAGAVTITATGGLLAGLDGLTLQSGNGGADAPLSLSQAGTGGIVFAPGTELIGGTFAPGPPATYGFGADLVVTAVATAQPLTLGNVHARALTLPSGLTGTITAGDITVDGTLTLTTDGAIRLRSGTSRTGDVTLTATGDVSGLARPAAAADGRLLTGYDRADLTALAAGRAVSVGAATAQLGTVAAGTGPTVAAGDQVKVVARAIDVTGAAAANGTLRLTATLDEARLDTGSAGLDAVVTGAASVRIASLTARTGSATATATAGDVTGLALAATAADGRLLLGYGRADLAAQAATGTVAAKATGGIAQLGTLAAGTGTTALAGDQAAVDARGIDVATVTALNGALRLSSTAGEVRIGTGAGGTDATVAAATNARVGSLTATAGNAAVTATNGDLTGLALAAPATDGRLVAGYGRADLAAQAATGTVAAKATAGIAQLGTVAGGTGTTSFVGDQLAVDARAIDVATATTQNGALRLSSTVGEVRLGGGTGGTNGTIDAASNARIGSLTARTGSIAVTARAGDATGLALAAPATDGRPAAGYGRTDLVAQAADRTVTVTAALGNAQLGTLTAGAGTATTGTGDQVAVDARLIDVTGATAQNAGLRLRSTLDEVRLGSGTGGAGATVTGATNARIGSLTARTGALSATAGNGDLTGLILPVAASDGRLVPAYGRADLTAQAATGTVAAKAAAGVAQLGTVIAGSGTAALAGDQAAVDARAIDVAAATTANGRLRLTSTAGEVRLGAGTGGSDAAVTAATSARIGSLVAAAGNAAATATAGDVTGLALATPANDGRLIAGYGRADLAALAATGTVAVKAAAGTAQLGTVAAGTGATTLAGEQAAADARAIDALSVTAQNGALRLTSTAGEVRLAVGAGGTDGTVDAAANARVGGFAARTGSIGVTARGGDATGLALATAAADSRPEAGYGLTVLDAGRSIRVGATDDVQLGTIRAGGDIDVDAHPANPSAATANEVAWLGGAVAATAGHYRVTGGAVVLGASGGIGQSAGTDLIVRSLAGPISGGDGLALASGVGSTSAANPLILYSAGAIALPATSTLIAGAGQYADIGLAAPAGLAIALGSASARRIGTAAIDPTQPSGYAIDRRLALPNPIGAHSIVTTADLVIDTSGTGAAADIVLDEAQSTAGGINLATLGDLRGRLLSDSPALYQRTRLTAFDGVVVSSGLALLDTVNAGTGIDISADRMDALAVTASAGDVSLLTSGDMRVDRVVAHGDGGNAPAALLADATIALSAYAAPGPIRSAGDILATSSGDITGTATGAPAATPPAFGLASFTATDGAVTLVSDATATGKGLLALDMVAASGTAAGHGDARLTGRQIEVATALAATAGSILVTARQLGSQGQVGATIARAAAARNVAIDIGYGTAPGAPADNGSLRIGTVQTTSGDVTIAARDGSVTGLAGTADGLDPAHGRALVAAGGNVSIAAGRLVQLGELSGTAATVAAGDDVFAPAQQGIVAHQDGAIDIAHVAARGALTLTAAHGATADGVSGIRLGARASGLADGGAASRAGAGATLRTLGALGDIVIADGLAAQADLLVASTANIRAAPLTATAGSISLTAGSGDVTGLVLPAAAADGRIAPGYDRAILTAQAAATDVTVTAAGIAQLDSVTAGMGDGVAASGGIAVTAGRIDLLAGDARNAALKLTSTLGETRLATGTAGTDATILAAAGARMGTLTTRTGSILATATAGDVTGLVRPAAAADGRIVPAYDRAVLTAQAAGAGVTVRAAAGIVQLGPVTAGAGDGTAATGGIAVDAGAIDVSTATAQNAALRLTSTAGEVRLATGIAGTDATIGAATNARLGTLTARTGSITVAATTGDATGLALAAAASDGRLIPGYGRADLAAPTAGKTIAVTATAGTAQLGTAAAGADATSSAGNQIAVDARAIDAAAAAARNGALRLTATGGEVRLGVGTAGTDAAIGAAGSARIGTLATRTGSIAVTAGGDATGLALASAVAGDGRLAAGYGRADLTARAVAANVTVAAAGAAQFGTVTAGTGTTTAAGGGIGVTAGAIDIVAAAAQNAALRLASNSGEMRLASGAAGTDATVLAATNARIGTLATRAGSIAVTATAGDVTGLAQANAASDGRLAAGYGRADLAAPAAAKTIAVTAAVGTAQLGALTAGSGTGTAGEQVAVDARAIDVSTASAGDGALRLASTGGETRLATGTAAGDATIRAATSARIGDLTARTGGLAVVAAAGDVTGLAAATATDTRPLANFGRANLTAPSLTRSVSVAAAAGTAQLGTVSAGADALSTGGGGIAVTARAIDASAANARNGALALTATADRLYLGQGIAATTATLDKQGGADELHVTGTLAATGNASLISATDIDLPVTAAAIASGDMLTLRNSGAGATTLGAAATGAGFTLTEAEVNSLKAPKLTIDSRANGVTIGDLAVAAAAGSGEIDLLGTGGFTIRGAIGNSGGGARTLQIGGATASTDAPGEAAIEAGTTLARSISGELENGAAIAWTGGTVDLRAGTILFGNQALRTAAVGTPESIAVNLVAASNSPLYIGALGTALQNKLFLAALKLRVSYTGYALFQNTNLPAVPAGAAIGPQDRSVATLALQLFSTGETPANSFALFGTINGFEGRTAGVLPAEVIDIADLNPRVVRVTQSNSRINGCVIGSPDKGCLVTDAPPLNFQLFDERQILLFGTADDAGLTFDPLIGTNNESLIGDLDQASLGINSIDCSAPGTRDCPAAGDKQ